MSHDMKAITALLHEGGYRVTPQRQLIIDAVCHLGGHVTPETVYAYVHATAPALNRATVYRTLAFLSEQSILNTVRLANGHTGYELAQPEPHHHLVCRHCGHAAEIGHDAVGRLFEQLAREHHFIVETRHLTLHGVCRQCQ